MIEKSNCKPFGDVEDATDREMKRRRWESGQAQFEQHMIQDAVRMHWQNGEFEKNE